MGRPQIYLNDWCLDDGLLKVEFLKKESENKRGLVIRTDQGYTPNWDIYPQFQSGNVNLGILSNGIPIQVTQNCYEKLKAKFRTFKKKDKDKDKVKKQYYLDNKTVNFISDLKEKNNYGREDVVIEYLVKEYQKLKQETQSREKIEKSSKYDQNLKKQLTDYKEAYTEMKNDVRLLQNRINELDDLLARAYLLNEFFKEILQEHKVKFHYPPIDKETIQKYKFEIRNNLRTYLE